MPPCCCKSSIARILVTRLIQARLNSELNACLTRAARERTQQPCVALELDGVRCFPHWQCALRGRGSKWRLDREIFWKSRVSLSKHIVVEYIDRVAVEKRQGMIGVVQKRRMASATAGRATSSPLNGRRRNDGRLSRADGRNCGVRRKGRKRQPGADSSDRPALTSTPTVERRRRRRHRRRHWSTHDTTTKTMTTTTTMSTTTTTTTTTTSTNARILLLLASWHHHDGGGNFAHRSPSWRAPYHLTTLQPYRIPLYTPTHVCFGIVSWISRFQYTSIAWCFVQE